MDLEQKGFNTLVLNNHNIGVVDFVTDRVLSGSPL